MSERPADRPLAAAGRTTAGRDDRRSRLRWRRGVQLALLAAFFALPAAGGLLNLVAIYFDGGPGTPVGLEGANAVAVSPDGRQVFVTADGDDSLAVFARDATAELLALTQLFLDGTSSLGLVDPRGVAVTPDGRTVVASAQTSDALAVFFRDASTESLSYVGSLVDGIAGVFGLDGARAVAGGDRALYVAGYDDDALAVFTRDASTTQLSFLTAYVDGAGGVFGLDGPLGIAADASNGRVFVSAENSNALSVFARSGSTEALVQTQVFENGVGDIEGLQAASGVARGPEGESVYVAGTGEDAIAVFTLRPFGFSFEQVVRDGGNGVEGLLEPSSLAITPDGRYLVATTLGNHGLAVFRRQPGGRLTFLGHLTIHGLREPLGLAVTPDGLHVIGTGRASNALAMLRVDILLDAGFESGDLSEWSSSAFRGGSLGSL